MEISEEQAAWVVDRVRQWLEDEDSDWEGLIDKLGFESYGGLILGVAERISITKKGMWIMVNGSNEVLNRLEQMAKDLNALTPEAENE